MMASPSSNVFELIRLIDLEVAVALPRGNVAAEIVPLRTLGFDQPLENVVTECRANDFVSFHLIDRFAQRSRKRRDVPPLQILVGKVIEILLDRLREGQVVLDPVDPGCQHRRERQIRIA